MTTHDQWQHRLSQATDYRELQSVFLAISTEANQATHAKELVESIDQAICRIEQERQKDQLNLQQFQLQYDAFKSEQRGVLGWFRRHLPFTETRKEERRLSDTVGDQQAEILADNFVIARAQMLKQRLLPPEQRQLGESTARWKSRFDSCASIVRIAEFASAIEALTKELKTSESFVREIQTEIDAFANAKFAAKEDRQRQTDDIKQARAELAEFAAELHDEFGLRTTVLKRAGDLVNEDLLRNNPEFRQLVDLIDRLQTGEGLAKATAEKVAEFTALASEVKKITDSRQACQKEHERLQSDGERIQRAIDDAQQRLQRLERDLVDVSQPFELAKRTADRAEAALDAAKRILSQQQAAIGAGDTANTTKNAVEVECERLQQECAAAGQKLQIASAPYDLVKSQRDKGQDEFQRLRQELKAVQDSLVTNSNQEMQWSIQQKDAAEKFPFTVAQFEPLLNDYLYCIDALPFQSRVELLSRSLNWGASNSDWGVLLGNDANLRFEKFAEAINKDDHELKKLVKDARSQRLQRWSSRCRELLGENVAQWVVE